VRNYQGIGAPLRRVEDRRLLLGRGRFVADIDIPGALACVLVRSPHAHARIRAIDATAARAAPGVVAVFTGAEMAADGMMPMRPLWAVRCAMVRKWPSRRASRSRATRSATSASRWWR
jgi:carbon-monoxide dehydrogenase large subunit